MSVIGNTRVEFNHGEEPELHKSDGAADAVFLEVDLNFKRDQDRPDYWTTLSTDEARELARELIAIADQYDRDAEENAKPKLPTEPGIYVVPAANHVGPSLLSSYALLILKGDGIWTLANSSAGSDAEEYARQLTKNWGPLVRLYAEKP